MQGSDGRPPKARAVGRPVPPNMKAHLKHPTLFLICPGPPLNSLGELEHRHAHGRVARRRCGPALPGLRPFPRLRVKDCASRRSCIRSHSYPSDEAAWRHTKCVEGLFMTFALDAEDRVRFGCHDRRRGCCTFEIHRESRGNEAVGGSEDKLLEVVGRDKARRPRVTRRVRVICHTGGSGACFRLPKAAHTSFPFSLRAFTRQRTCGCLTIGHALSLSRLLHAQSLVLKAPLVLNCRVTVHALMAL